MIFLRSLRGAVTQISLRYGNGIVVARLADGSWSAPSAIGIGGADFDGQAGFKFTDFIFVLNDTAAVQKFSHQGLLLWEAMCLSQSDLLGEMLRVEGLQI